MRACDIAAAVAAIVALSAPARSEKAERAGDGRQMVLVYNEARLDPKELTKAEDQASRIFREARIELFWVNCAGTEDQTGSTCDEHLKEPTLIVKVLGSAGPFPNPETLAYAAVDSRGGRLAMIYLDRIRRFESRADPSCGFAQIVGNVIAHEIGHLLLSMVGHSPTGIMTADWRTPEMRRLAKGQLLFTYRESTKMLTEVKRRNATRALIVRVAACTPARADGNSATIRVCFRLNNAISGLVWSSAQVLSSEIFWTIGITLEWRSAVHQDCRTPGSARTVMVDLFNGSQYRNEAAMAYANAYEGSHAIVLVDRVDAMADGARHASRLLGHILTHEIAHLIQQVGRHSPTGVMKAHWDAKDLMKMKVGQLAFTAEDVDFIQRGLRSGLCKPGVSK